MDDREPYGRIVHEIRCAWHLEQRITPTPWEGLDDGERERDMRIGLAISMRAATAERERICKLADDVGARYLDGGDWSASARLSDLIRRLAGA